MNEVLNVMYNEFLPLIYIDNFITRRNYMINPDGTVNDLFKVSFLLLKFFK